MKNESRMKKWKKKLRKGEKLRIKCKKNKAKTGGLKEKQ